MKYYTIIIALLCCSSAFGQTYKNEIKLDVVGLLEKEASLAYERYFFEKWATEARASYFIDSQYRRSSFGEFRPFRNDRYTHFRLTAKHYILPSAYQSKIFMGLGFGGRYLVGESDLKQRKNFFTKGNQTPFTSDNDRMLGIILQQGGKWYFLDNRLLLEVKTAILVNLIDFNRRADTSISFNASVGYAF